MAAPPPPEIPAAVGPFTVLGLRHAEADAQVVEARDPHGRRVDLVLLTGGISDDPAARDRFVAAAEARFRADPDSVLGASPAGTRAWVAAPPGTGEGLINGLLAATRPASDRALAGPHFGPYWRDRRPEVGWQEGLAYWSDEPARRPWWRIWWMVALFLLAIIALLLLFSQCAPPPPDIDPSGSPTSGSSGSQSSGSGSETSESGQPNDSSTSDSNTESPSPGPSGTNPSGTGPLTPTNPL